MKILFCSLLFLNSAFALTWKGESITRLVLQKNKKNYEVIIENKAAYYSASEKLYPCLKKGLKEKIDLDIDPKKLVINSCNSRIETLPQ